MCLEMENQVDALGLCGPVSWSSEGATGVPSVKTARSFPTSNRAKAKPITDNGNASGITCLRRENVLQECDCSWR